MEIKDYREFLLQHYKMLQEEVAQIDTIVKSFEKDTTITVFDRELLYERYNLCMTLLRNTQTLMDRYSINGEFVITSLLRKQDDLSRQVDAKLLSMQQTMHTIDRSLTFLRQLFYKQFPELRNQNQENNGTED